ncbi:hypothetical protein F4703DRAFT_1025761 [Phycomyces blakesleeanus]
MDEINALLEETNLASLRDNGLIIVSIVGNGDFRPYSVHGSGTMTNTTVVLANRMVGQEVFVPRNKPLKDGTIEVVKACQLFVDKKAKIAYLYLDSVVTTETMAEMAQNSDTKNMQDQLKDEKLTTMKGLLIMLLMSHLVIFLSTLSALSQVKQGIYTHLSQLQSACWKCWDINVPNALFERKEGEYRRERERFYPNLMGWWGPAKGVPMMVFVAAEAAIPNLDTTPRAGLPMAIKRHQETLQK